MRITRELHNPMFRQYSVHEFSEKLKKIDSILDLYTEVADWVMPDLAPGLDPRGAAGMTAEEVLRAGLLMQIENLTYRPLEFHLKDSMTMRAFVKINDSKSYSRSALQSNIKSISDATWQKIHGWTVMHAKKIGIEKGKTVRMDATVVESNISSPRDSQLMVDCLRVISRIAFWMKEQGLEIKLAYKHKKPKATSLAILNAKNEEARLEFYLPLILGSGEVFMQLPQIISTLEKSENLPKARDKHIKTLNNLTGLFEGIIAQTIARVVDGDKVDSCDKIISIFEEHSDVIVKSRRETEFGHKFFLTTGKSNLVIDCQIADGNPADSERFMEMLHRTKAIFGKFPSETSADGGFSSAKNVVLAKKAGVKNVCFNKRCGLEILDMCKTKATFKRHAKFRAGIESNISALKRGFGLTRAFWKGSDGFNAFVWS